MAEIDIHTKSKQTKKRIRNPSEWKREKRKRLRVAGKSYVNSRGEIVSERKIGDDCRCRRKCYNLVPEEQRNKLFNGYYSLNSHDEQNAYLFGLIRKHDIARKRCKESDRRTCSYKYFVRIRGQEVQICRLAFARIHGISPHKIRILCQKQDQNIMYPRDERGKHDNRPRKISTDTLTQVKEHIYSIIRSERVREFLKDEKHSGPDVNITKMWKDFLEKYDPNYYEIFHGNEKKSSCQIDNTQTHDTNQLANFTLPEITQVSHQHLSPYCASIDMSQYPDNLLGPQPSEENYDSRRIDMHPFPEKEGNSHVPVVKHWFYSKVFHEEFKFHDFLSLKKKLLQFKDSEKSIINQQANKAERKQKTPKKISRDKDIPSNGQQVIQSAPPSEQNAIPTSHHQLQTVPSVVAQQTTDMYLVPINLQDLSQLPSSDVISQQHHTMQLNLHTFSAQANVLSPLVNIPGNGSSQCSSMVSLPVGTMTLAQNSCGYVNAGGTTFYQ